MNKLKQLILVAAAAFGFAAFGMTGSGYTRRLCRDYGGLARTAAGWFLSAAVSLKPPYRTWAG